MARRLRPDESGVASTVATMLTLFVVLIFIEAAVVSVAPQQQYTAEWVTSRQALQSLDLMRSALSGAALPGSTFSVAVPIGTPATSPFATASEGALLFNDTSGGGPTISFRFVPHFQTGQLERIDQDVVLVIDSSGSMGNRPSQGILGNDPTGLRYVAAKQYIDTLEYPDRVAIVDFDHCAGLTRLTWTSYGGGTQCPYPDSDGLPSSTSGAAHHLYACGHEGDVTCGGYAEAKGDLDVFTCPGGLYESGPGCKGGTNFGIGLKVAIDELTGWWAIPGRERVIILLTDGANSPLPTPGQWDSLALAQAARAKALGIKVYTIGLIGPPPLEPGAVNEDILKQIAATTGATYYRAPTAESVRFIYYEISQRYSGAFACGSYAAADLTLGSVSLTLGATQYPRQTFRMEGGALSVLQNTGASIHAGLPLEYTPTSNTSGELSMTLLTFTGAAFSAVGTEYAIVQARVLARDVEDQRMTKVDLGDRASAVSNTSAALLYWVTQSAITQAAADAIRAPLELANATIRWADANVSTGKITSAKFNIDSAQSQLSVALQEVANQSALGPANIQPFLANQTRDDIALVGCQLHQWINWYDGITIRIDSPAAAAWAIWLERTFANVVGGVSIGLEGNIAVLSIHGIDRFVLDRRIVELSLGR